MMPRAETAEVPDRRLGREGRAREGPGLSRCQSPGRQRAEEGQAVSGNFGGAWSARGRWSGREGGGGRLRREGGRDGVSERLRGRPAVGAWWAASAMCTRIFMYTCGLRKLSHLSDTIIIFILGELFSLVG